MTKPGKRTLEVCIIIAGPNGAAKTTFAREYLEKDKGVIHFVNADLIAGGLSPLRPESAAFEARVLRAPLLDAILRRAKINQVNVSQGLPTIDIIAPPEI